MFLKTTEAAALWSISGFSEASIQPHSAQLEAQPLVF